MTKLSPEMGPFFSQAIRDLSAQSGERTATNRAEAVLQENQRSVVTTRGFQLVQDEPVSVMGGGTGPTPTDLFVSSVAVCENVIFARNAALKGVSLDSLETVVEGSWNMKGLYEIDGAEPSFKSIKVETRVKTTSPVSSVIQVAEMTHRRCPIHATLSKSLAIEFRLIVNGLGVPL